MPTDTDHLMFPGGPVCPCPGSGSVHHRWFNEGRTEGQHDALRLAKGISAAVTLKLIAGNTDQVYTPNEVAILVNTAIDEQASRLGVKEKV